MKNQVVYKILKEKNETYENQETTEKWTSVKIHPIYYEENVTKEFLNDEKIDIPKHIWKLSDKVAK